MSAAAIAAGISAAGSIAGSVISNKMNLSQNKKFFDYTLPKNQQAQYDMIRKSPVELVRGYKDAGLNPAGISSTYEGGGAQGETVGSTQPITADPVGVYMQMRQLKMNEDINAANVRKANAEAANLEAQTPWIDRLNQATIDAQTAEKDYTVGKNQREADKNIEEINNLIANTDLLKTNKTYQEIINDANNKMYEVDGKMVKGSEIPNVEKLVSLKLAAETLKVAKYNAVTGRREVDGDPKKLAMNEIVVPLLEYLKKQNPTKDSYIGSIVRILTSIVNGFTVDKEEGFDDLQGIFSEGKTQVGDDVIPD